MSSTVKLSSFFVSRSQQAAELLSAFFFDRLDAELWVGHHLHGATVCRPFTMRSSAILRIWEVPRMVLRAVPVNRYALLRLHFHSESTDNTAEYLRWISAKSFLSTLAVVTSSCWSGCAGIVLAVQRLSADCRRTVGHCQPTRRWDRIHYHSR